MSLFERYTHGTERISDGYLGAELARFIRICAKDDIFSGAGRQHWDIFPTAGNNTNEILRQLLQQVIVSFPQTSETFIGRQFPQGSYLELRNPQTQDGTRTLTETCYIPTNAEPFRTPSSSAIYIPTLQIDLKRSHRDGSDPGRPLGTYETPAQPRLGEPSAQMSHNVSLSYWMIDQAHFQGIEQLTTKASLNAPGPVVFELTSIAYSSDTTTDMPSDLQNLLQAVSQFSPAP